MLWFYILIGFVMLLYIFDRLFRHVVHVILIGVLKTSLHIIQWVDRVTCSKPIPAATRKHTKTAPKPVVAKTQRIPPPKLEPVASAITSRKSPDGKLQLVVTDSQLEKWLSDNPELKVSQNDQQ